MVVGKNETGLDGRATEVAVFLDIFSHFIRVGFYAVIKDSAHSQTFVLSDKTTTIEVAIRIDFDFYRVGDETMIVEFCFYLFKF